MYKETLKVQKEDGSVRKAMATKPDRVHSQDSNHGRRELTFDLHIHTGVRSHTLNTPPTISQSVNQK